MREETQYRRDVEKEIRAQIGMAAGMWTNLRAEQIAKGGPGYLRWSGKDGARAMRVVAQRCLNAGLDWRDIETAIRQVVGDVKRTPYDVLDAAFASQSERFSMEHLERKAEEMRGDEGRTRWPGLKHI